MKSLAYQALENEGENPDESNILQLVHNFTPCFQGNVETQALTVPANKFEVKKQNQSFYKEVSKTEVVKLSKAESYLKYKNDTRLEKYLCLVKNTKYRKALARFRLSYHPLMIEKGRYRNPRTLRTYMPIL